MHGRAGNLGIITGRAGKAEAPAAVKERGGPEGEDS